MCHDFHLMCIIPKSSEPLETWIYQLLFKIDNCNFCWRLSLSMSMQYITWLLLYIFSSEATLYSSNWRPIRLKRFWENDIFWAHIFKINVFSKYSSNQWAFLLLIIWPSSYSLLFMNCEYENMRSCGINVTLF